jgi:hypothetical protein
MAKSIKSSGGVVFNIYINFKEDISTVSYLKDIYWYDYKIKKSYNFKCSYLKFDRQWNKEINDYINVPIPVIENINVINKNKESLKNILRKYLNYNSSDLEIISESDKGLIVQISNNELDYFEDFLKRDGFNYNIL